MSQGTDLRLVTVSCKKNTLIFDWTVLEDQEELGAVLWTRFRVISLGSEIVWKLSENVSCSRTSERAEKPWFQKKGPPTFFSPPTCISKESNVFSKSVASLGKHLFC